jgi:hypothetical protein
MPLYYCCVTYQPTVYQEPGFAVTRLVSRCPATTLNILPIFERAYARRRLSCRCLAIHVTILSMFLQNDECIVPGDAAPTEI